MAKTIIRNDINYGNLVVAELNGVRFLVDEFYLDLLKVKAVETEVIPEFNPELSIWVNYAVRQVIVYALDNADVRKIAAALSTHVVADIRVQAFSRILATYDKGSLTSERLITDFYSNLTPEQIELCKF